MTDQQEKHPWIYSCYCKLNAKNIRAKDSLLTLGQLKFYGEAHPEIIQCVSANERRAMFGSAATKRNKATAGPVGLRRFCSQFCRVRVLI